MGVGLARGRSRGRGVLFWGLVAGLFAAYLSWGCSVRWLQNAELRALDLHFKRRGVQKASVPVVTVTIDPATAHTAGFGEPGSMPRTRYADLIRRLKQQGVKVVVFDLLFVTQGNPAQDAVLAQAIGDARNVVLATTAYRPKAEKERERWIERRAEGSGPPAVPEGPKQQAEVLAGGSVPDRFVVPDVSAARQGALPGAPQAELPLPEFLAACRGIGAIDIDADADGHFRHAYLLVGYGGRAVPSLSLAGALAYWNATPGDLRLDSDGLRLPTGARVPISRQGALLVDFLGGRNALPEFSMAQLVQGAVRPQSLRGAVVVVGSALRGGGDQRPNPYSDDFYGVHLHAQLIHSLLSGSFVRSGARPVCIAVVMGAALLGTLLGSLRRAVLGLLLGVLAAFVWMAVTDAAFVHARIWVPVAPTLVGLVTGYLAGSVRSLVLTQARARGLRAAFERFGVPELAERLAEGQEDPELFYGRRSEVAVLFCDLRDFTRLLERVEVREVVAALNLFFERVDLVIREHGGVIDKYIGDCVMGLFLADGGEGEHARDAVRAGLAILREMSLSREEWFSLVGEAEPRVNIGIQTGKVVLCAVGSRRRIQYTAIGAAVNEASELEKLCGAVGSQMLVSGAVYDPSSDLVTARPLGPQLVPDRLHGTAVYEILGPGLPRGSQASSPGSKGSV